ncbi:MAG: aspartate dehydrogenase [Chloroflexota bacterium]|jgi:aspartate dehydrogenase|nr:aspartate dehydrogenase [Chloroflexota bacterium]
MGRTARRVALIGYGASGRGAAELIRAGAAGDVDVCAVLVRDPERYAEDAQATGWRFTASYDELMAAAPEVVVELAGHPALAAYGEDILRRGLTLLTISAGLFGDEETRDRLLRAAAEGGGRLILPSGAIAGLDAIESASIMGIDRVRHVVRKPPASLFSDPAEIDRVVAAGEAVVLYEGPAREATRRFPQNVNVVAMVALAGIGMDRTTVAVIADPNVRHNTHEVTAEGPFGTIEVRVQNVPSPHNPKTGLIVAGSICRALSRLDTNLNIGG